MVGQGLYLTLTSRKKNGGPDLLEDTDARNCAGGRGKVVFVAPEEK